MNSLKTRAAAWKPGVLALAAAAAPVAAHHSAAAYDTSVTRVFTGVVVRVLPDANHLIIYFQPMNEARSGWQLDNAGKPLVWQIDMAGSAASAREGITVGSFAQKTVFSAALHPVRGGASKGMRSGPIFKCPASRPPAAGRHCDSVTGHEKFGAGTLPPLAK